VPDLIDALARHTEVLGDEHGPIREDMAARLVRSALSVNRAVVLLDGLDEVTDERHRELVAEAVEDFALRWILRPGGTARERLDLPDRRAAADGNQLLVTSRNIGYKLAPLRLASDVAAHYVIRPLDDGRVERFTRKLAELIDVHVPGEALGTRLLTDLEGSLLPGLDRLKRTPLLLTSLISYWYSRRRLPRSRAELYRAVLLDLCARWRDLHDVLVRLSPAMRAAVDDGEKLMDVLGSVARAIHDDHPSGRITRDDMEGLVREIVSRVTARTRIELDGSVLRAFDQDVEAMLALMSTQVGALVEVAPGLVGFLHLTFREYLVGRDLLQALPPEGAEEALADRFLEHIDEPRWREPLLFAFGETGLPGRWAGLDRRRFLDTFRRRGLALGTLAPTMIVLFIADLVAELQPEVVTEPEAAETFAALAEGYRSYGAVAAAEGERQRVAERVAELRRRGGDASRAATDARVCGLIRSDPALSPALAHLYWERRWLVSEVLDAFAGSLEHDSAEWGWSMHAALRWVLLAPEGRITPEPIDELKPPAVGADDGGGAQRRFERALPVWERMKLARDEEVRDGHFPDARFPLRAFFCENPAAWLRLGARPEDARAIAALLAPVDDWRAAAWTREYVRLSRFLQRGDHAREHFLDQQPEAFLPRWGSDDVIYTCAVYLDKDPGGRFKFGVSRPVVLSPAHAARHVSQQVDAAVRDAAHPDVADGVLRASLLELTAGGDASAVPALVAMGVRVGEEHLRSNAVRREIERARDALTDAVWRAGKQHASAWFTIAEVPGRLLSDTEAALVYRAVAGGMVEVSGCPHGVAPRIDGAFDRLGAIYQGEAWAAGFTGMSDDAVYTFAVLLDTLLPKRDGWAAPLPLLANICASANAALLRGRVYLPEAPLWGVSPQERLVPPEFFRVLHQLDFLAAGIAPDFGDAFADSFLAHLPLDGIAELLERTREPSGANETGATSLARGLYEGGALHEADESFGRRPFAAATAAEMRLWSGAPDPALIERVAEIGKVLLEHSPVDGVLFLARAAEALPGEPLAGSWMLEALAGCARLDVETRAEMLARLRLRVAYDSALAVLHATAARAIDHPLLRSHAEGRLGRHLTSPQFSWNDPENLGVDAAWVVTCVRAALAEALALDEGTGRAGAGVRWGEADALWKELSHDPSVGVADRLCTIADERGLLCTSAAVAAVEAVCEAASSIREVVRPERLVTLLRGADTGVLGALEAWLVPGRGGEHGALLAEQAAILAAETARALRPEWVDPLFAAIAHGDDLQAGRADLALGSPVRLIERERRFNVREHGVEIFRLLCARFRDFEHRRALPRHAAQAAVNDWEFNDEAALAAWCAEAAPGSEAEATLLGAMDACDRWSPKCQRRVAEWAMGAGTEEAAVRRQPVLLAWMARHLVYAEPQLEMSLLGRWKELERVPAVVACRGFPARTKDLQHHAVVAAAVTAAADKAVGGEAVSFANEHLERRLVPVLSPDGAVNPEALTAHGDLYYHWIGQYPERGLEYVRSELDRAPFRAVLADWLLDTLGEWRAAHLRAEADPLGLAVLGARLEALLGFATCLAVRSADTMARLCEPERFLEPLASVCLWPPTELAHMAAVTLIANLKQVDLDVPVRDAPGGGASTVLDALLAGLRGKISVQQRVVMAIPRIFRLHGVRVMDRIEEILTRTDAGSRLHRGTEVLAAAELLTSMRRRGALNDAASRRRSLGVLREAVNNQLNHRPLYQNVGNGSNDNPLTLVLVGDLREELRAVLARD
jgi:hypothetical protein